MESAQSPGSVKVCADDCRDAVATQDRNSVMQYNRDHAPEYPMINVILNCLGIGGGNVFRGLKALVSC